MEKPLFTVAAISDIHVEKYPLSRGFFDHVNGHADILVIGGDMNNGKNDEVRHFLDLVSGVKIPVVIIFGNHDCDTGDIDSVKEMLGINPRMRILDGEYVEYEFGGQKLGIAGTKGYGGGFAPHRIIGRGELATKSFLKEEDREVEKLESALRQMESTAPNFRLVVTHWAAFEETLVGEPKELYIVLGSSRLGDAIDRAHPHLALSGHAHYGAKGIKKARGKISACNIAYKANEKKMSLFDFFPDGTVLQRYLESH